MRGPIIIDYDTATEEEWETVYETLREERAPRDQTVEIGPRIGAALERVLDDKNREYARNFIEKLFEVIRSNDA